MSDHRDKTAQLRETLEAMLEDNEDVTARGVVRRLAGTFRHASDITRIPERRQLLEVYQARQAELRTLIAKANKQSKSNLSVIIERQSRQIAELTRQRDMLIASHKAMILAVGEMRGMKAWLRFFTHHQAVIDELRALEALPTADVVLLPHDGEGC